MTAAPPRSFPIHSYPRPDDVAGAGEKSWDKVFPGGNSVLPTPREMVSGPTHARARDLAAGTVPARIAGIDPERFRDWFVPAFARWLHLNYRGPEAVAPAFGVTYRTAVNWWNGDNRAQGDKIGFLFLAFPQAMGWFLAEFQRGEGAR